VSFDDPFRRILVVPEPILSQETRQGGRRRDRRPAAVPQEALDRPSARSAAFSGGRGLPLRLALGWRVDPMPRIASSWGMNIFGPGTASLDTVAHIIQIALTPVFLLSGIATLLNVFSTRLARVSDRVEQLTAAIADDDADKAAELSAQLSRLRRRSVVLDAAVVLSTIGGAATCGAVLTLFVGALGDATVASVLFVLFGLAVLCTLAAIGAFTTEMLMAGTGIRARVAAGKKSAARDRPH
jgi:hypothetical protein